MDILPAPDHTHAPHSHGTGWHWLDVVVAVSAVFISVVSLAVSIEHGRTMERMVDQNEKMVEASTLPILEYAGSHFGSDGKPLERITLYNRGMGPAIIDRFEIRYKGISYVTIGSLLRVCCANAIPNNKNGFLPSGIVYSNVSGSILPAREQVVPIQIDPALAGKDLPWTFDNARADIQFHACYCSVLGKCWETDFDRKHPQPVKACRVNPGEELW